MPAPETHLPVPRKLAADVHFACGFSITILADSFEALEFGARQATRNRWKLKRKETYPATLTPISPP